MAPIAHKREDENWFQKQIIEKLTEVKSLVDESLKLGRQNGEDIRSLRTELGVDGAHGRLPQLEQAIVRFDRNQENDVKAINSKIDEVNKDLLVKIGELTKCVDELKAGEHQAQGGTRVKERLLSFLSGSFGAATIGILAKMVGWIH